MQKGINLKVRELKEKVTNLFNESGLPICFIDMILSEMLTGAAKGNEQSIAKEKEEYEDGLKREIDDREKMEMPAMEQIIEQEEAI